MTTALVLGACGGIGSVATRALTCTSDLDRIVAADNRADVLGNLVKDVADDRMDTAVVDVTDHASLVALMKSASIVVNCVGPFYRFGEPILSAAIEAQVDYVDVCDDLDATLAQLALDAKAKQAGIRALIGMGSSPGLANVLARYAADLLLDTVESVDICHIHGGEPTEGPAVLKHRIHAMVNDVPVFVDGQVRNVRMLEESGREFSGEVNFRDVGTFTVHPYPHPETVTLPRHLAGLKRATNRGAIFPTSYFELTMSLVRDGLATTEPLNVNGAEVIPLDIVVAHLIRERPKLLAAAGVTGPAGCLRVDVEGVKDGVRHRYVFSSGSSREGAGAGTGIPAALGALMILRGHIADSGVNPPEAVIDPVAMMALAGEVVAKLGVGGDRGGVPLHIEHILPDGSSEELALSLG